MTLFVGVQVYSYIYGIYILINGSFYWVPFTKVIMSLMGLFEIISFAILAPSDLSNGGEWSGLLTIIMAVAYLPDLINMASIWILLYESENPVQ